jgi:uncharacterized membrane protein
MEISMKTSALLVASAIVTALSLGNVAAAQDSKTEKCYGVAKAGKNDCQTASSSCAGTSKRDMQADAFIAVPAGTCAKIVGGALTPKA